MGEICEKMRFSTEIAIYLENGTRQAHGCYGTLIGNHGGGGGSMDVGSDDPPPNPGFKVTVYFRVEYLKNRAS